MSPSAPPRSPIAMVVLALLQEEPMHAYRMHELIRERGQDKVVNVAARNSVYQAIARLERDGLIRVQGTTKDEGRPERVVYRVTEAGSRTLHDWLASTLSTPVREYPSFPAALAFIMVLTPKEALGHVVARAKALAATIEAEEALVREVTAGGLPRLFIIEEEFRLAMLRTELGWVEALAEDLRSKKLTWSRDWLKKVGEQLES